MADGKDDRRTVIMSIEEAKFWYRLRQASKQPGRYLVTVDVGKDGCMENLTAVELGKVQVLKREAA